MIIQLHKDYLLDKLQLPESAIKDDIVGHRRWSVDHEIIFAHDGRFWKTSYSVGATESQYESPWENEEEVECVEVKIVERLVKSWDIA